jgi:integrase
VRRLAAEAAWNAALRGTGVRPRKFYASRHTFISVALTHGVNLKWLAEYCGTSVAMIERSYGRFLAAGSDSQLELLAGDGRDRRQSQHRSYRTAKTRDLAMGSRVLIQKTLAK